MDFEERDDEQEGLPKWPFLASALFILSGALGFAYYHYHFSGQLEVWQLLVCILASGTASLLIFMPFLLERSLQLCLQTANRKDDELFRKVYFDLKEVGNELETLAVKVDKVPTLVEQTLEVSIDNEELRDLRTIGDVKAYLNAKAKGEEPPKRMKTYRVEEIASLMPHKEPFMFLESATIAGDTATARYKISGNEYFLEGHFKENPVFPASIMIEALGQLCVFFLLKGENEAIEQIVNPNTIYFTSCDGAKCRRICKPGDTLEMQVKVNRMRHPLASFQGEITVEGQKTSTAEEVKLAFDYYPVIDGEVSTTAEMRGHNSSNGNGSHPEKPKVSNKEEVSPRFVKFSSNS